MAYFDSDDYDYPPSEGLSDYENDVQEYGIIDKLSFYRAQQEDAKKKDEETKKKKETKTTEESKEAKKDGKK